MNDVVINKIQIIQRCIRRAREEYQADAEAFSSNYTPAGCSDAEYREGV